MSHKLKTLECVNALLLDLFIDLRKKVNYWSSITGQTSQARMGYIGQHLVSAVTGYRGGKSGARGRDLIINETEYAEIKTCTKVDQLGCCHDCGSPISSVETKCPKCGSLKIDRKDDSKWLISIKSERPIPGTPDSEDILVNINKPKWFFFVLFEYENIEDVDSPIIITIYRVDPKTEGFTLCMLDYFYNIKGSAPFNMWPHMFKFALCSPGIIYQSKIKPDGSIETIHFCPDEPYYESFIGLRPYCNSKNLKNSKVLQDIYTEFSEFFQPVWSNDELIRQIDDYVQLLNQTNPQDSIDRVARGFYKGPIREAARKLEAQNKSFPEEFDEYVGSILE